jgi:hypothetical protein
MELTISALQRDLAKQTIGKERAALFRHYRVVARKQRPDVFSARVKAATLVPCRCLPTTAVEAD